MDDPIARLLALEQFGIKLGLENIRLLLAALDAPERSFPSIHIAGTNGKGSVSAIVERGLRAAGCRTGRYTSPHLDRIEERIALNGTPVPPELFAGVADDVLTVADDLRRAGRLETTPTFFEVTTAMAFEIFRRERVDIAVVEVGLGGRFDATNVITPTVTAITSIALDHERHLGNSVDSIAREKAGILKAGIPAVIGDMPPEARRVIEDVARTTGAPIVIADRSLVTESALERGRATISVTTPARSYRHVTLGLHGAHQISNAIVALRVLELIGHWNLPMPADAIVTGLRDVDWAARLEWLAVTREKRLLIDAAHNPSGARALAEYINSVPCAPLPVVLAVMKDKDVDGIVRALLPIASQFVATTVGTARALPSEDLADCIRRIGGQVLVEAVDHADAAVERALHGAPSAVLAGSIFLVGPLRARLIAAGAVSLRD